MKCLIVFYSLTGGTKRLAQALEAKLAALGHEVCVEEILPVKPYSYATAFSEGCRQAVRREVVEIRKPKRNPNDFGLLFVLSPVWAFTITPPIFSYLSKMPRAKKKQKAVCGITFGGLERSAFKILEALLARKGYRTAGRISVSAIALSASLLTGVVSDEAIRNAVRGFDLAKI